MTSRQYYYQKWNRKGITSRQYYQINITTKNGIGKE